MKTRSDADRIVKRYLADLSQSLASLPASRRREIQDEISAHIVEARIRLGDEDEAAARAHRRSRGDCNRSRGPGGVGVSPLG